MLFVLPLALAFALQTSPTGDASRTTSSTSATSAQAPSAEPDANGVYHKLSGVPGMTAPELTHQVEPLFSKEERKKKFAGTVLIGLIVDARGNPANVHVVRSAAEGANDDPKDKATVTALDQKALDAVSKYRFKPATLNGKPVAVQLNVEVNFQIH